MITRKRFVFIVGIVAVFSVGFWAGNVTEPALNRMSERIRAFKLFASGNESTSRVVVEPNAAEKETDMTARAIYVDGGETNRFRTLRTYYEFMRKKNPGMYERMQESRRRYEEAMFVADEKRIKALRKMDVAPLSTEERADIQRILEFNEVLNTAVDALNSGAKMNVEELSQRYRDLYQVFEREKRRQVTAYGQTLGAANFGEKFDALNALTPQQFFQSYWIVNEKLRENQEEKK